MLKKLRTVIPILLTVGLITGLLGMALPAMAAEVTATKNVDPAAPNMYHVGDTIHYVLTLSNPPGNAATNTFTHVADHDPSGVHFYFVEPGVDDPLVQAPGDSDTFLYDYVVQAADIVPHPVLPDRQAVINELHGDGSDSLGDSITVFVEKNSIVLQPDIQVIKTVEPALSKVGDEVVYTIEVINTGIDTPLERVSVIDSILGDITASFPSTLADGESSGPVNFPYVIQAGDPDPLLNEVTAIYSDELGLDVSDFDTAEVNLFQPSITIDKTADTEVSKPGDSVNYTITVTNTSSDDTPNLIGTVEDTLLGLNEAIDLAPGANAVFNVPYVVMEGDPDPLVNTATVTVSPDGFPNVITASDTWTVELFQPSITIDKTADTEVSKVGDTVNYTITVTNTSSDDTPNLIGTVEDALLGLNEAIDLAPGANAVFNVPYVVMEGDPDPLVNTATVTVSPDGFPNVITDSASWTVSLFQPSVIIEKTADTEVSKVGDTVNYTITVTNTSSDDTPNLIGTVEDALLGLNEAIDLAPGANAVFDVPYVVMEGDPDPLVNTATVTVSPDGFPNVITDSASWTVNLFQPSIMLEKACDPSTGSVGTVINYTVVVTNTSSADTPNLQGTVTDTLVGDLGVIDLAPGESAEFNYSRAIESGDPSPLVNTATVTASPEGFPNVLTASDSCEVTIAGDEGCTPGYWKANAQQWEAVSWGPTGYSPDDLLSSVFSGDLGPYSGDTLLEALSFGGGPRVDGAKRILLRAAVAAVLNAAHPDINYAMSAAAVIDAVNTALDSNDRGTILALAEQLDMYNNAGCSLDMQGNAITQE